MTEHKILTIGDLEKAIEELRKQYEEDGVVDDISEYWVLKSDVLEKIGELKLFCSHKKPWKNGYTSYLLYKTDIKTPNICYNAYSKNCESCEEPECDCAGV